MRRFIALVDQLPGWGFVVGAALAIGSLRGGWIMARLHGNSGASELGAILFGASVVVLVIFAVRRRQTSAWRAAGQVLVALAVANLLGVILAWPFLPFTLPVRLSDLVSSGAVDGAVSSVVGAPVATAGLWLSRRYGSHSAVTERRLRIVRNRRTRVYGARRRGANEKEREAI